MFSSSSGGGGGGSSSSIRIIGVYKCGNDTAMSKEECIALWVTLKM
jgi:hypothetical protein